MGRARGWSGAGAYPASRGTLTFGNPTVWGASGLGVDLKFWGGTASNYMLWDASENRLVLSGTAADMKIGEQANVTGSGSILATATPGILRVFSEDGGANIADSVRGVQSRLLLTVDQSAGTVRALQGQLKLKDLADVTTGIYTALQGYVEMAGTHIAKTGSTFSTLDLSTEIGTALTVDSGGEYFGAHIETTGAGTITNNGTCAAIGITKASGAASWPVGLFVAYNSSITPISVGTKANASGSGVVIPATDDWGAVRVFTDDNGVRQPYSIRGVQSRMLLTIEQTGGTFRALQGQMKILSGIHVGSGVYTAAQGYLEVAAASQVHTGGVLSCFDASAELGAAMTVDSGGRFFGIHVETTGGGTIVNNGLCAGIGIDKASGAASWPVGIQIDCDSVIKGIQVGTLGSNITQGVPLMNATSINGFYSDDNGADQTTGTVHRNLTCRTYFSVDQTASSADYYAIRGHIKAASGVDFGGDTSVKAAVNGYSEFAGATIIGAGSFYASVLGEIWGDGNVTGTGKAAGVMSRLYTSAGTASGTLAAFMATKQFASTQVWPYGLYIDAATCDIRLANASGAGIYSKASTPNGSLTAPKGSICLVADGSSASTRLFVNTDGSTTWVGMTSAS
jgi:hypothetical protein